MQITLSPMRRDDRLCLSRRGAVLVINGVDYDFSPLPDGAILPQSAVSCDWLVSDVRRQDGVLHLTLILPHGSAAPPETLFPAALLVTADGPIALPPYTTDEARHVD